MTTAEITDVVNSVFTELLGLVEPPDMDKTWQDYGADSLDEVEIITYIEEELDIEIDDIDAERLAKLPISGTVAWLESQFAQ